MNAAIDLAPLVGAVAACAALAVSRATLYRRRALSEVDPVFRTSS